MNPQKGKKKHACFQNFCLDGLSLFLPLQYAYKVSAIGANHDKGFWCLT